MGGEENALSIHDGLSEDACEEQLDLALAAELQNALMPSVQPVVEVGPLRLAALNRMSGRVGGDFYEVVPINRDQTAVIIGDVVGHGVRAALLMAQMIGLVRSNPEIASRPLRMVQRVNRWLIDLGDRTGTILPCSIFVAVLDAPSTVGFFVNCGHPMPVLADRSTGRVVRLGPRNMILGVEEFEPREACHTFTPGERMVLYTDGLCEAADPVGREIGDKPLLATIRAQHESPPDRCARALFDTVDHHRRGARQGDDETVLIVDRT